MGLVYLQVGVPENIARIIERSAIEGYISKSDVARKYLIKAVITEKVVELRSKNYSISRITEILGVPMTNVLQVLSETQIDEELYPVDEKEEAEQEKLINELAKRKD